jgi:hypothetical protein
MDDLIADRLADLLLLQSGVLNRRQALEAGRSDNDLRRLVRRRELVRVSDCAVYVDHTGPLSWIQRAWVAVLSCEPAALWLESARRAADGPGRAGHDDRPIDVAIARDRHLREPEGVRLHRVSALERSVLWNASPPRQRIEHAVLSLAAAAAREIDAVAYLADALGARQTTASRLADALDSYPRIARRGFLASLIADVACGTCSTLEHGYLTHVERPHGLPSAQRQFRDSAKGPLYRDAYYEELGAVVELDGRLFHARVRDRDRDLERDLDVFATRATVRLGWGQVFDRSCVTAAKLGAGFNRRGWTERARRCPRCPPELELPLCG